MATALPLALNFSVGVHLLYNVVLVSAAQGRKTALCELLSRFRLFATPWTARAPLSMGLSRQEYWSGWPFSFPGNLPNPEIEPAWLPHCRQILYV